MYQISSLGEVPETQQTQHQTQTEIDSETANVFVCFVGWLVGCFLLFFNSKHINVGILVKTTCIHPLQYTFHSHPDLDFLAFIIKLYMYGLYAWAKKMKENKFKV